MTQSFIGDGILAEFDGYCVQLSCKNVNGHVDVITLNLKEWEDLRRFMVSLEPKEGK